LKFVKNLSRTWFNGKSEQLNLECKIKNINYYIAQMGVLKEKWKIGDSGREED